MHFQYFRRHFSPLRQKAFLFYCNIFLYGVYVNVIYECKMKKYAFDVSVVLKRSVSVEHWLHNYCWNFSLPQQMQAPRHKLHRWWSLLRRSMISVASSAADVVYCNSFHACDCNCIMSILMLSMRSDKSEPKSKKLRVTITLNSAPLTYVEIILKIEVRRRWFLFSLLSKQL